MSEEKLLEIIQALCQIEQDVTVPKNVRNRVKNTILVLEQKDIDLAIKVDKSLQELDGISEDPNLLNYSRTQIWNILSLLESI